MKPINEIYSSLALPKNVVITFHQKPDGDAMGSGLGLYHFLHQFGHSVQVMSPTNWAGFLNWMPGVENVLDYEANRDSCHQLLQQAHWVFCLDFNTLSRVKDMEAALWAAPGTRILIDHHQKPDETAFEYGVSDTQKSSTAEMVYDLILQSGHEQRMNLDIAECLYTGVMTDTGSFRFGSTSAHVHRMVARLKDTGLNHTKIHENMFDNFLENRYRFIGNVLLNRMEVFYEYNAALIAIPQKDLIRYEIKTGDTEGLVNYPLGIQGIKMAALVIDRGDERKWSFRSKGEFDVNTFARTFFNGGGHFNAAGGKSSRTLAETIDDFKAAMHENANILST